MLFNSLIPQKGIFQISVLQSTDNLTYIMASVGIEPVADTASHLYCNLWIKEIGRAYLYCRCTRHKELYSITGI